LRLFNKVVFRRFIKVLLHFQEVVLKQFVKVSSAALGFGHEHAHHHVDEGGWHLILLEQQFRVRMVLEEVGVARLRVQEIKINIILNSGPERWSSKGKNEEKYAE